jgi:YbbR domain-containing protein
MMAFRKFETGPLRPPRVPNATERWLRRIFVEDWSLKLLALAITLGLWFVVTGQRTPITRQFRGVQLNFHVPTGIEIGNDPPAEVAIMVSGPQSDLERINPRDLAANVDITDRKPGQRVIQLIPGRTQIALPDGVRLEAIEPATVSLKLEPNTLRELPVEPRLEGTLPDEFELGRVTITPDKVKVRGPASHVFALQKVPTETISIEGRRANFDVPEAAIYIADQKVDALETVSVHIEITQRRKPKTK